MVQIGAGSPAINREAEGPTTPVRERADLLGNLKPTTVRMGTEEYAIRWEGDIRAVLYHSGQVMVRGEWSAKGATGRQECYYEDGNLWSVELWLNGEREGESIFYSRSGIVLGQGSYEGGFRVGRWIENYEDGRIQGVGDYSVVRDSNGLGIGQARTGYWTFFDQYGNPDSAKSGRYVADSKVSDQ
ncbi:MAG: hypothetical protein K8J09_11895 [Planctomycetes bacterium]|nr:hypothetical protein [Planctomycetota bacterium]MCC7398596.1 hypothetical protein [Planctomycetota bacterium]